MFQYPQFLFIYGLHSYTHNGPCWRNQTDDFVPCTYPLCENYKILDSRLYGVSLDWVHGDNSVKEAAAQVGDLRDGIVDK